MVKKSKTVNKSSDNNSEEQSSNIIENEVKKLISKGKEKGYLTYTELEKVLNPQKLSIEKIEDIQAIISELGISLVDSDEDVNESDSENKNQLVKEENPKENELGRTDDPVRMYLREMGNVELLSREGEIAIAKRIEAGRDLMFRGISRNPLTLRNIVKWNGDLKKENIILRDVIDLEATYGSGPDGATVNNPLANAKVASTLQVNQ